MTSEPTWTVLVTTLAQRAERLRELLELLLPQTEPYDDRVRVLAYCNRGERPLAAVRQALVEAATSDYVSFVDDDDRVPTYHVDEVMNVLPHGRDVVGWQLQCYVDGEPLKPTFHSLRYSGWYDDVTGYYRDVSHLNPIRRELALRADFRRGDPPEDVSWVEQVRSLVRTESYVDRVMYFYYSSPSDSTWRGVGVDPTRGARLDVAHPHFSYHPESSP